MTVRVRVGGAWKTVIRHRIRVAGIWRDVISRRVRHDGEWRPVFTASGAFSASADPAEQVVSTSTSTATGGITITPEGGVGPYTYAHTVVFHTGASPVVLSPSSALSFVRQSPIAPGENNACQLNCLVTDSVGQAANVPYFITFFRSDV